MYENKKMKKIQEMVVEGKIQIIYLMKKHPSQSSNMSGKNLKNLIIL